MFISRVIRTQINPYNLNRTLRTLSKTQNQPTLLITDGSTPLALNLCKEANRKRIPVGVFTPDVIKTCRNFEDDGIYTKFCLPYNNTNESLEKILPILRGLPGNISVFHNAHPYLGSREIDPNQEVVEKYKTFTTIINAFFWNISNLEPNSNIVCMDSTNKALDSEDYSSFLRATFLPKRTEDGCHSKLVILDRTLPDEELNGERVLSKFFSYLFEPNSAADGSLNYIGNPKSFGKANRELMKFIKAIPEV